MLWNCLLDKSAQLHVKYNNSLQNPRQQAVHECNSELVNAPCLTAFQVSPCIRMQIWNCLTLHVSLLTFLQARVDGCMYDSWQDKMPNSCDSSRNCYDQSQTHRWCLRPHNKNAPRQITFSSVGTFLVLDQLWVHHFGFNFCRIFHLCVRTEGARERGKEKGGKREKEERKK